MKRSEMLSAIEKNFPMIHFTDIYNLLEFIEEQGMLPPPAIFLKDGERWNPDKKEWYPTKERFHSNKWEPEE